jgi:hypothetical protein
LWIKGIVTVPLFFARYLYIMKLINSLKKLILEQSSWSDIALESTDYDDISGIVRMFSGIDNLFFALEKRGKGVEFLERIGNYWDDATYMYIFDSLGGVKSYQNGMIDTDLMEEYLIKPLINEIQDLNYTEDGRIVLEVIDAEKPNLFHDNINPDCRGIARQIFVEEELGWDNYQTTESLEDLVDILTEENYIGLVRLIGIVFENKIVTSFREEFGGWKEEDNLDEDEFYITLDRMNTFLGDDRYNLAVLLDNTDELEDIVHSIEDSYNSSWNSVVQSQYFNTYHKAVEDLLGKPIGTGIIHTYKSSSGGKHVKVSVPSEKYDVTDLAKKTLLSELSDYGSLDNVDFVDMMDDQSMSNLCPRVNDWPDDDDIVEELFNEGISNYL